MSTLPTQPDSLTLPHQPTPRTDANSLLAHQHLLTKARTGRIDLYFLGDSITRRWGCTDPQWAHLLQNWTQNFHGWHAANFGWGADRIEHILWRIHNGELDNIHPKVIVLLAGTNNLPLLLAPTPAYSESAIVAGLRALISACQLRAPRARIILTAIFPRTDIPNLLPVIARINHQLRSLADGSSVLWLDLTPHLTDPTGNLLPDMTYDGLHPTPTAYQLWADALHPLLTTLLGPRSPTDSAPPPTGDPAATPHPAT